MASWRAVDTSWLSVLSLTHRSRREFCRGMPRKAVTGNGSNREGFSVQSAFAEGPEFTTCLILPSKEM